MKSSSYLMDTIQETAKLALAHSAELWGLELTLDPTLPGHTMDPDIVYPHRNKAEVSNINDGPSAH